ncbi:MAG: discoidin domain-containing protein, partial [Kiritimatiellae bacterium]|nr:discoidin domain-containing protein [Kiritimatiellia bacterium]
LNRTAYKYYKFSCTGRNSTSADGWIELYEIQFYVDSVFDLTSPATGGVVASSPAYIWDNYQYLADYAFDSVRNVNTSRWIASRADHMYFVYGFDNPTRVNGISLYMPSSGNGNNTSARAPKDWTVSGSNDGAAWTLLDTQSGETDWSEGEERYYEFANMSKYRYYKYDCTANNSANDVLQIMEIELTFHNSGLPSIGNCSVTFSDATSLSVSAEVDLNGADKLSYILNDGETVTTNAFATSVAEGQTGATTISGLSADKTYEVSILAENAAGTAVYPAGSLYTGELTLGAVVNASEDTLAPGTVAVSRASADNVPLTVYYTITGTTGSQGTTWAEPVGIVIPAGETTGYLLVTPLADLAVSENIEVAVSLAPGNYGIPASGSSATLTIENDDTPEGWTVVTLVNSFDSPAGGYMGSSYDYALTNNANLIVRFTNPESAPAGLREFALAAGNNIEANASVFPYDWMLFSSCSSSTNATGTTVDSVRYASESLSDGLTEKRSIRAYAGSWYIPADGTYSFRMHMRHCAVFSIDGQLILRQPTSGAVSTNGVELTKGWHSFYAGFVASASTHIIGPAANETYGLAFSATDDENPDTPFTQANCRFSTAFSTVLTPSVLSRADIIVDCSNVLGDLRVSGQLWATPGHQFRFVNIPAGGSLEFGRPLYYPSGLHEWQNLYNFAFVDWTQLSIPSGVGIRFEGAIVVNGSWTDAGRGTWSGSDRSAFSLGRNAMIATQVPNFFGTAGAEEFLVPDGLRYFQFGQPSVIGDTATIKSNSVNQVLGIGIGGAPFIVENSLLPVKVKYANNHNFYNDFDIGSNGSINHTMPWFSSDVLHGDVLSGNVRGTGWGRRLQTRGRLNLNVLNEGQRADFFVMRPVAGTAPSYIGTVSLASDGAQYPTSGWGYTGASAYYFPEVPGENPLSIGTLTGNDAFWYPESPHHGGRRGATFSTCSNNVVNVGKLNGGGIHLRILRPNGNGLSTADNDEQDDGPANFVFGEFNGSDGMKVFVSSNVNVTVTNIVKRTSLRYDVMSNSVNRAVLDIEGTVAEGTTITATDVAMLPARVKGFTGHDITLTETEENRTYPVVFDFDNHGGVPVGGCDGSGNLVAAPTSGHIDLSFSGEPVKGRWGILRFDNANGLLNGWTVTAPQSYRISGKPPYIVRVVKDANGFSLVMSRGGLGVTVR